MVVRVGSHILQPECSGHVFLRLILRQLRGASNDKMYGRWFTALRAQSVVFLPLTATLPLSARVGASSGGVRLGSGPDDGGGHLG